ncbi:hypothetical protein BX666DRAFT_1962149 [Dichotomocladium elegans]|nr:hypothetical protein BX666DRAFT_1962149 [Dichotomocladium elegans]
MVVKCAVQGVSSDYCRICRSIRYPFYKYCAVDVFWIIHVTYLETNGASRVARLLPYLSLYQMPIH